MELTVHKTKVFRQESDKDGKRKAAKWLWALVDKYGHTFIQIYDEDYPKDFVKFFREC